MVLTYFKRYRMEIELPGRDFTPRLPAGYRLVGWDAGLLEVHSQVKFHSFRDELDANVFPCFCDLAGCQRLMTEITRKQGFLPEATWLAVYSRGDGKRPQACGTVQGVKDRSGAGSIQNLGIVPEHRGLGVGTAMLFKALAGFCQAGLSRVFLEVTADNEAAIRLYHRLGFRTIKTVFKAAEVPYP